MLINNIKYLKIGLDSKFVTFSFFGNYDPKPKKAQLGI